MAELRYAIRSLVRTPGFTIVGICSLAIGLSLTAVTAAVVNAYLLRSLPYAGAERLYRVSYAPPGPWEPRGMSGLDWRSVNDVVEYPVTSASVTYYLRGREFARSVRGLRVAQGFVEGLGVRTVLGRTLEESDFAAGAEPTALIGHGLWREQYGADPHVLGTRLPLDVEGGAQTSERFRIVGVLSEGFYFGRDSRETVDLLVPLTTPARTYMVRLRAGVPVAIAQQRITEAARRVALDLPEEWDGVTLTSVREQYVAELRPVLNGVSIACGVVLLIVCVNTAVLMLLRTQRRQKELAIRTALGCERWRLARMLLVEAAVICAAAGLIALLLAGLSLQVLAPIIETQLGRPAPAGTSAIAIDSRVLLVLGAVGVVLASAISLLPLMASAGGRLGDVLRRETAMTTGSRSMRRFRSSLVVLEIAGTLVLLIGCGLMLRSVVGMLHVDLGFDSNRLVRARVVLRGADYTHPAAFSGFYSQFSERLGRMAQTPVAFTNWPAFVERPSHIVETPGGVEQRAGAISVSAGYFSMFGIQLTGGREFTPADTAESEPVVVISATLARRLWGDEQPLGRRIRVIEPTPDGPRAGAWRTIVGVSADVRQAYDDRELGDLYVPLMPTGRFGSFYLRTDAPLSALVPMMRAAAAEIDPHAVVDLPRTVSSENHELAGTGVLTALLAGVGAIAGFLAVLGMYGVTAYAVQQRARETAIRIALGAASGAVVRSFMRESVRVLAIGLALGLAAGTLAADLLEAQLFGVRRFDVPTLAAASAVLGLAGLMATWWPSRRAALRDPVTVLKEG